ncbi:MAG: WecB/TagA/CpsF family glycosyltransferase [Thermoleophilia bacterium]|nr:WecB/TagA/CpsF family glycosyltransferase [Thermoleophilia bacterium]
MLPVLGFKTFVGNLERAAAAVVERGRSGAGGYAVLANVHVLVTAQRDRDLSAALRGAWHVFPDGAPVAWLQRRRGRVAAERIAGAELMLAVARAGAPYGLRHAFFGGTRETLAALEQRLTAEVPGLLICESVAPPFAPLDTLGPHIDAIRQAGADVVWVALGAPKQEIFMARHAAGLGGLALGVGAAFDFLSGSKSRAPRWMQRTGFEWAHRLASEPRRLAGRYLRTNSEFLVRAALELCRGRG